MNRTGKVLGNVLAIVLTVFSLVAMAETNIAGRDFNHMSTGFPLTGVHLITACETCHVAGVFKGTARNCDGCHALGKRVVATPKSTSHIVTDAPCETCHFNASTFLGAKYNHGTAQPRQCLTCHNGRLSAGRPASHSSGSKATNSCDQCHRSYAWLPATWNHFGVTPGSCANAGCHVQGSNQYFMSTSTHIHNLSRTSACDNCHNYFSWTPRHMPPTKLCSGCHNDVDANGPLSFPGHMPIPAGYNCTDCHSITTITSTSWVGGVYRHVGVIPGSCSNVGCHIAGSNRFAVQSHVYSPQNYSIMMTTPACDSCHTTSNWTPTHITPTGTCNSCHDNVKAKGSASYAGHAAVGTSNCTDCHSTTTITSATWAGALGAKPANHIPYNASALCSNCHPTPSTWLKGASLHAYVSGTCKDCHNSSPVYLGNMERKTLGNHEKSTTSQDCISCHARQYTKWNSP